MPVVDPESPEQSLGDCAICMDAIHVGKEKNDSHTPGGAILNAVGGSGRKIYSLAPCHHLFVSLRYRALEP
jgi:transmembrane E3 ubiquitin-protein ligase